MALNYFSLFSVQDHNSWMSNGDTPIPNTDSQMTGTNFNPNTDLLDSRQTITSNSDNSEFQPKQKIKIRRKKVHGENPIKKLFVRQNNAEFVGHFLTSTTTTESPSHGQLTNSKALNRTADDSRCKSIGDQSMRF